jgi:hypothetical protein
LIQAGDRTDDFADDILSQPFSGIGDKFAGNPLHLPHAKAGGHQFCPNAHDPTHADAPIVCCTHSGFCSGHPANEFLNFVGWTFLEQEGENYPNRFLGHAAINRDIRDETVEKIIHGPTPFNRPHSGRLAVIISTGRQEDKTYATIATGAAGQMTNSFAKRCTKVTIAYARDRNSVDRLNDWLGLKLIGGAMPQREP